MQLNAIHHVAIIASDYARSKDFYVNILGFSVVRETIRPQRGDVKLDLKLNDSIEIELFGMPTPPARPTRPEACGLRHLAFRVESVAQTVRELEARGVSCEPVRMDEITGKAMTFFFDPDGLPLELHE